MIRAVIFDCFGVLTTDSWRAFVDSLPEGVDAQSARELNRAYGAGIISKTDFLDGVKRLTGYSIQHIEQLLDNETYKNLPLLDYIRDLRSRGLAIGLLSNIATNWIRDSFLTPDEQALFDQMILSFEVGITKPDPRIFHLACEKLDTKPTETVLIDDVDRYCQAARAEGLNAILYTDLKQMKHELEALIST